MSYFDRIRISGSNLNVNGRNTLSGRQMPMLLWNGSTDIQIIMNPRIGGIRS